MTKKKKPAYYAYILEKEGTTGVVDSWQKCEAVVKGRPARYRSFDTRTQAEGWLRTGALYELKEKKPTPVLEKGIYFDAGTGRGQGVEVYVTDERKNPLLPKLKPSVPLTAFKTFRISDRDATNNYGELLGMRYALLLAAQLKKKRIFGDSKLVLNYWSKGFIKEKSVAPKTVALAREVKKMTDEFVKKGGTISFVSGDYNPADLGFHR